MWYGMSEELQDEIKMWKKKNEKLKKENKKLKNNIFSLQTKLKFKYNHKKGL